MVSFLTSLIVFSWACETNNNSGIGVDFRPYHVQQQRYSGCANTLVNIWLQS